MPWFFIDHPIAAGEIKGINLRADPEPCFVPGDPGGAGSWGEKITLTGETAAHISKSLRMTPGESLCLCGPDRIAHTCVITQISAEAVYVRRVSSAPADTEPPCEITLFYSLPKGSDKLDSVIQKSVELGAGKITPVLSERCVSRPSEKDFAKKQSRLQKIALQAAMQSRRAFVPEIGGLTGFSEALRQAENCELTIFFYEGGGEKLNKIITGHEKNIAVFIGPEGGYSDDEAESARQSGAKIATLGKRILRTETAPVAALAIIMDMLED